MSLRTALGAGQNLLDEARGHSPQLDPRAPGAAERASSSGCATLAQPGLRAETLDMTWPLAEGAEGLETALERLCEEADDGDRRRRRRARPLRPRRRRRAACRSRRCSRLGASTSTSSARATRLRAELVVESGEPREVHHLAALIGYGASAVNPYLMLDSARRAHGRAELDGRLTPDEAPRALVAGAAQGPAEGALEDGDLDDLLLPRRPDLRGGRARPRAGRAPLHRDAVRGRRGRARRARPRGARPPRPRLPRAARPAACADHVEEARSARRARGAAAPGRRLRLAPRRRAPHVGPGDDRRAPAASPRNRRRRGCRALRASSPRASTRRTRAPACSAACCGCATPATPMPLDEVEPAAEIVEALLDRRR